MIDQAQGYSKEIDKYSDPIKKSLNSVISSLDPLESSFGNINTNLITPWKDIVKLKILFLISLLILIL